MMSRRYAALHAQTYGEAVDTVTSIPHMLEAFMARDRALTKTSRVEGVRSQVAHAAINLQFRADDKAGLVRTQEYGRLGHSHGVPMRPIGTRSLICPRKASSCCGGRLSLPSAAVSVGPGLKPLTRMSRDHSSPDRVRARESNPALLAA